MPTQPNPVPRPRLSVAMIVRDEQEVLSDTIDSARSIADEIVALDTGSTDQTRAMLERSCNRVSWTNWKDDFSAARNRCLEQVSGDWVLWLDAGEKLAPEFSDALRQFVDQEADPQKVYLLMVEMPSADPSASNEQVAQLRLMPNRRELRFHGRVCETVRPSMRAAGLEIDAAPGRIARHPRQHDPRRKISRAQRNLKLIALESAEKGRLQPRLLLAKGEAYSDLNDHDRARQTFLQAVEGSPHGSTEMLEGYYGLLASYDSDPKAHDRQLAVCLEALDIYPTDTQLLLTMGNYLCARGRLELANRSFRAAFQYGQVDVQAWHLQEISDVAAVCLGLTLQLAQKDDEARAVLQEALNGHESSTRIRRHLIDLHIKHRRTKQALQLVEALPLDPAQRGPFCDAVRGACKATGNEWTPALGYLQSAYAAGCRDTLCLRWLSVTLLSNGQIEAADPVLRQWYQQDPGSIEVRNYIKAIDRQRKASREVLVDSDKTRRIRIDPGTSVLEIGLPPAPIVGQASTVDPSVGL